VESKRLLESRGIRRSQHARCQPRGSWGVQLSEKRKRQKQGGAKLTQVPRKWGGLEKKERKPKAPGFGMRTGWKSKEYEVCSKNCVLWREARVGHKITGIEDNEQIMGGGWQTRTMFGTRTLGEKKIIQKKALIGNWARNWGHRRGTSNHTRPLAENITKGIKKGVVMSIRATEERFKLTKKTKLPQPITGHKEPLKVTCIRRLQVTLQLVKCEGIPVNCLLKTGQNVWGATSPCHLLTTLVHEERTIVNMNRTLGNTDLAQL